jgi:hypothetical protein
MLYDALENRIPKAIMKEFVKDMSARWNKAAKFKLPEDEFDQLVRTTAGGLKYSCKGESLMPCPIPCSRVMTAPSFAEYHLDWSKVGFAITGHLRKSQINLLETNGLHGIVIGKIRGTRPFAWVTPTENMQNTRASLHPADSARNHCGLIHYSRDENLVELVYPADIFMKESLYAPTFLDGYQLVYQSKRSRHRWGLAVELATLADGYPEAVHPLLSITGEFVLKDLGRLKPLSHSFDFVRFVGNMEWKWNWRTKGKFYKYVK